MISDKPRKYPTKALRHPESRLDVYFAVQMLTRFITAMQMNSIELIKGLKALRLTFELRLRNAPCSKCFWENAYGKAGHGR